MQAIFYPSGRGNARDLPDTGQGVFALQNRDYICFARMIRRPDGIRSRERTHEPQVRTYSTDFTTEGGKERKTNR
jgi:hypothetical protein